VEGLASLRARIAPRAIESAPEQVRKVPFCVEALFGLSKRYWAIGSRDIQGLSTFSPYLPGIP
jgi:hypothetical protein